MTPVLFLSLKKTEERTIPKPVLNGPQWKYRPLGPLARHYNERTDMHQSVSVPTTVSPSPGGSSAVLQSWFGNNVAGMWLCVGDACGV